MSLSRFVSDVEMNSESESTIDQIKKAVNLLQERHPEIAPILSQICEELKDKDEKINELNNECTELKERVLKLERYNSKDCLIVSNFPLKPAIDLTNQTVDFLNFFFNADISRSSLKACHFLGDPKAEQPVVIVKFIYFEDKNYIWRAKKLLFGAKNPANGQFMYINERLPEDDKNVHKYANKQLGLKTVTDNCVVKLETTTDSGASKFIEVRSTKDVDRLKDRAVAKSSSQNRRPRSLPQPSQYQDLDQRQSHNIIKPQRFQQHPGNQFASSPMPQSTSNVNLFPQTSLSGCMPDLKRGRIFLSPPVKITENTLLEELHARKDNQEELMSYVMGLLSDTPRAKQTLIDSNSIQPFLTEEVEGEGVD